MKTLVIALGALLAAPCMADDSMAAFELHVDVGRYAVMLDQVGELSYNRLKNSDAPEEPEAIARNLREVAWKLNLVRSRLCESGLFVQASCVIAYSPAWLAESAHSSPKLSELRTRANSLGAEVTRFWEVVCADAKARMPDENERFTICMIE